METRLGQFTVSHSARGIPTYSLDLWHDGLKKHRLIRGEADAIVRLKVQLQIDEWNERWSIVNTRERDRSDKLEGKRQQEQRKAIAGERNKSSKASRQSLNTHFPSTMRSTGKP